MGVGLKELARLKPSDAGAKAHFQDMNLIEDLQHLGEFAALDVMKARLGPGPRRGVAGFVEAFRKKSLRAIIGGDEAMTRRWFKHALI